MDTLSNVSEYLNNLKVFLDDGDSLEARKVKVEKSEKELEIKPFMRFSTPCGVDGQGAWDVELDMADSHNYMTEEMFDKLGFVRVDYGDYGRKMVKEVKESLRSFLEGICWSPQRVKLILVWERCKLISLCLKNKGTLMLCW
ncbi:hypothetical protein Tco_1521949 [Tanacetum coccineum]